jgi:hypothetical protein
MVGMVEDWSFDKFAEFGDTNCIRRLLEFAGPRVTSLKGLLSNSGVKVWLTGSTVAMHGLQPMTESRTSDLAMSILRYRKEINPEYRAPDFTVGDLDLALSTNPTFESALLPTLEKIANHFVKQGATIKWVRDKKIQCTFPPGNVPNKIDVYITGYSRIEDYLRFHHFDCVRAALLVAGSVSSWAPRECFVAMPSYIHSMVTGCICYPALFTSDEYAEVLKKKYEDRGFSFR